MSKRRLTDEQIHERLFDDDEEQSDVESGSDEVDSVYSDGDESDDMLDESDDDMLDEDDIISDPGAVADVDSDNAESDDTWILPRDETDEIPSSPQPVSPSMPPGPPPSPRTPIIIMPSESLSVVDVPVGNSPP